jgi:hypothetical protein
MHTMPPDTPRHSRPLGPPGLVERDALVLGRNHAVRRAVRGRYSLHRIADLPVGTGGPRASSRQSLSEACMACGRAVTRACARAHTPAAAGRVARQRAQAAVHRPGAMHGPMPCAARCQARCHARPGAVHGPVRGRCHARPGAVRGPVPCAARCRARPGAVRGQVPCSALCLACRSGSCHTPLVVERDGSLPGATFYISVSGNGYAGTGTRERVSGNG